jgi:hypothetical protein
MSTYGGMPVCLEGLTLAAEVFEKSPGRDGCQVSGVPPAAEHLKPET